MIEIKVGQIWEWQITEKEICQFIIISLHKTNDPDWTGWNVKFINPCSLERNYEPWVRNTVLMTNKFKLIKDCNKSRLQLVMENE